MVQDKIEELLLEEETINEVLLCKTIYIPEDHIDEFSENSQTAQLWGGEVDLAPVLKKVAVGTGVILTLVIVKKANLPQPVASVVAAAADKSLGFAAGGAGIGSLFGGVTGAADEIDESGRTSAVIGFATATAGLILAAVSLISSVPSAGSSTITAATGVKLVIAGIGVIAAAGAEIHEGYNLVKTFTSTDAADIDWDSIDWEKVGVASAQQAIQNGADGYMWGSIVGAVYGGAEGYEYYENHGAPYSTRKARLDQTPKDGDRGHWTGERGESDFILSEPIKLADGTEITKITYKNCIPDFSPYAQAKVRIPNMTADRRGTGNNFDQADEALAKLWSRIQHNGQKNWTARDIAKYREANKLSWHEMNNMEYVQLVPTELNGTFDHLGGCGEYTAMIKGENSNAEFD